MKCRLAREVDALLVHANALPARSTAQAEAINWAGKALRDGLKREHSPDCSR